MLVYMFEQSLSNISHKYGPGLRKNEQTRTMTCICISQGACALWGRKFASIGSPDVTENIVTLPNLGYYVPRKWHVLTASPSVSVACTSVSVACTSMSVACTSVSVACTSVSVACQLHTIACHSVSVACTSMSVACQLRAFRVIPCQLRAAAYCYYMSPACHYVVSVPVTCYSFMFSNSSSYYTSYLLFTVPWTSHAVHLTRTPANHVMDRIIQCAWRR